MPERVVLDESKVSELRQFIGLLEKNPEALHSPELDFFKKYLLKLGATIPPLSTKTDASKEEEPEEVITEDEISTEEDSEEEKEDQEDDPGRMERDTLCEDQFITERFVDLTEEEEKTVSGLKEKLGELMEKKDYEKARETVTAILKTGNPTAMMYAKRAEINLRLKRPMACIEDCNQALKHNPDNGKAYRLKGCAYRALQEWDLAHSNLEQGQRIDFDEALDDVQKYVEEKWKKLDLKRREKERRREDRKRRNLLRERRRRQAAVRKAYEAQNVKDQSSSDDFDESEMGGQNSFPDEYGSGAAGGAAGLGGLLGGLMGNPEMKKAMSNPKILQAVMDMMQNPSSFSKYQNDPEIMSAFTSLMSSMKGAGGFPCGGAGPCPGGKC